MRVRERATDLFRHSWIRSYYDVNRFCFETLHDGSWAALATSLLAASAGVIAGILEPPASTIGWGLLVAGAAGSAVSAKSLIVALFPNIGIELLADDGTARILSAIELPVDYRESGYRLERSEILPVVTSRSGPLFADLVARSSECDRLIRSSEFEISEHSAKLSRVTDHLRSHPEIFDKILRQQYALARGARPRAMFFNEGKIGLSTDILLSASNPLRIFRTSYFHSLLTNDLVGYSAQTLGPSPEQCYSGSTDFPAFRNGKSVCLSDIADSYMNDHIGVSTVVITSDRKLVLWEQAAAALHSHHLIAPTGSGSCDWSDWQTLLSAGNSDRITLRALITHAMGREFREESRPFDEPLLAGTLETELIGHFRWVHRGGKPEFIAVSKTSKSSAELKPNVREVSAPKSLRVYPAASLTQLSDSVSELLLHERGSVPLWATMRCLSEIIENEPEMVQSFLMQ